MHEAKSRLSELVAQVEAGGDVVITRRGRRVARLVRFDADRAAGRGAMAGRGTVTDLTWAEVEAGDAAVLELFPQDGP
jgi:antitoxin (DNA-binding transcriptional repressor) of toxin-antitoxin stability system